MRHLEVSPSGETVMIDEAPSTIPLGTVEDGLRGDPEVLNSKGKPVPPTSVPFPTSEYTQFQRKSLESKREYLKAQWLDIAFMTLWKGKLFARSVTKKDFGKLVQLLMAAGISWDKVFPKVDSVQGNNLVLNLFNGLPKDKVVRVIGEVPLPKVEPLLPPTE